MLRHGLGLHRRGPQASDVLPSRIDNPTASLPPSIGPTAIATPDPSGTAAIVTAEAASGFTTITETQTLAKSTDTGKTTFTTEVTKTITNSAEYASITSVAAAASSTSTTRTTTSTTSAAATSSAAAKQSNSNLSTIIPAIVVPVAVILVASLAVFWFFMRRRHRRELQSQPEFVMTGKGEKLHSRSSSSRSTKSNPGASEEKKPPVVFQNELPSAISPPTTTSEWPPTQTGAARPQTPRGPGSAGHERALEQQRTLTANSPYRNFRGPGQGLPDHGPRPATAGRPGPPDWARDQGRNRNRSNSTPGQRDQPPPPRSGPGPVSRKAPSPVLRSGPSPVLPQMSPKDSPLPSSTAFRFRDPSPTMDHSNRAQAPSRLVAPPPGAFNGASAISQYSPIVKDTPTIPKVLPSKRAPPPINTAHPREATRSPASNSPAGQGLTEENMRIARLANSSRLGHAPAAEPSPSPKLPPPATRSQLIPRESPKEHQDRFFGGGGNSQSAGLRTALSSHHPSKRASFVSDADEYEDIDAKSDVSSLNEFERFDFGTGIGRGRGSPTGNSLTYFAAANSPASERGGAFGTTGIHERW